MSVYSGQPGSSAGTPSGGFEQPWHRWQDWVNLILGIWLFVAPWIIHATATRPAETNAWVLGPIVVVVALCALAAPQASWAEWVNTICGIWLFIAPWALGFALVAGPMAVNQWIVGIVIAILSIWAGAQAGGRTATTA